jgi:hypothetical protein
VAECGMRVEPEQPEQLAAAIAHLKAQPELCAHMALGGKSYVATHLSFERVLGGFADTIRALHAEAG